MSIPPMIYVLLICLVLKIGLMVCLCGVDMFTNYSSDGGGGQGDNVPDVEHQKALDENTINEIKDLHVELIENELNEKLVRR